MYNWNTLATTNNKNHKQNHNNTKQQQKQIRFLSSVRHPYIVGFLEAFLDRNDTELCIVMEYCSYGDLAEKVERYKTHAVIAVTFETYGRIGTTAA